MAIRTLSIYIFLLVLSSCKAYKTFYKERYPEILPEFQQVCANENILCFYKLDSLKLNDAKNLIQIIREALNKKHQIQLDESIMITSIDSNVLDIYCKKINYKRNQIYLLIPMVSKDGSKIIYERVFSKRSFYLYNTKMPNLKTDFGSRKSKNSISRLRYEKLLKRVSIIFFKNGQLVRYEL